MRPTPANRRARIPSPESNSGLLQASRRAGLVRAAHVDAGKASVFELDLIRINLSTMWHETPNLGLGFARSPFRCGDESKFSEIINHSILPRLGKKPSPRRCCLTPSRISRDAELDEPLPFQEERPRTISAPMDRPTRVGSRTLPPERWPLCSSAGGQAGWVAYLVRWRWQMIERTWVAGVREGPFIAWSPSGEVEYRAITRPTSGMASRDLPWREEEDRPSLPSRKSHGSPAGSPMAFLSPTSLSKCSGMIVHYHDDENATIDFNETFVDGEIDYGPLLPEPVPVVVDPRGERISGRGGNELNSSAP